PARLAARAVPGRVAAWRGAGASRRAAARGRRRRDGRTAVGAHLWAMLSCPVRPASRAICVDTDPGASPGAHGANMSRHHYYLSVADLAHARGDDPRFS